MPGIFSNKKTNLKEIIRFQNDPMDLLQFIKHFGCFKMCQEYASVLDGEAAKYEKNLQIKDPVLHIE